MQLPVRIVGTAVSITSTPICSNQWRVRRSAACANAPPMVAIPEASLENLASPADVDRERQLDDHKLMMLLRASLDPKGLQMLEYRLLEYDWSAIASAVGYSSAHSAEVQFRKKLDQALARMEVHHGVKIKKPMKGAHA